MVLYKRKPITLPDPEVLPTDLNIEVWHIDETGEWFTTYEKYLERFDFYSRHHFTCEITGTSCLTFFEALDSEETQFRFVEERFPLKLREPVARFLHFNGVKRLDALVERVYVRFKNDFFPGETVYLKKSNKDMSAPSSNQSTPQPEEALSKGSQKEITNENTLPQYQRPYIIKEKAQFNATTDSVTGEVVVPAYSKYMLTEENHGNKSLIADQSQLYRDRSTFTKHLIKCFCKITLRRASSKMGSPWAVKDEYLPMYGLTMDWPPEMLKYKEDEAPNERGRKQKFSDYLDENDHDFGSGERDDTEELDVEESVGNGQLKRRRVAEDIKDDHIVPEPSTGNVITSILEDLRLPYEGPPNIFPSLFQYNQDLELIHFDSDVPIKPFKSMGKLLQVFQFLNTFGPAMLLSHFSIDQLITSLKCADPQELAGEVVYVEWLNGQKEPEKLTPSDWKRNWALRSTIENFNTSEVRYTIVKNAPASEEEIDNINSNGTGLLIEVFCALLRLFIDENGDWSVSFADDWLEEEIENRELVENGTQEPSSSSDSEEKLSEVDQFLEKCLNYRNVNWAERLSKRQFNNSYWLIILLGILQECKHIPMYKVVISQFSEKLMPDNISSTQLPKQLWRCFCSNLSLREKVDIIWILVDFVTNYSPEIKAAVDQSLDLCGQIRSERFRVGRDLKAETITLNQLRATLQANQEAGSQEQASLEEIRYAIAQQQTKIDKLQCDKAFLDQKLMENDIQRLRPLGMDRYGNKYYWLDLNGVPKSNLTRSGKEEGKTGAKYHSGRVWIQGPTREAAKFYLKITDDDLNRWLYLAESVGKKQATEIVFKILIDEDGSYKHKESGSESELVNKHGLTNSLIELTPIQKKVIDETPACLLLSDSEWYSIDRIDEIKRLVDWLNTWGRREHDLLRQFAAIETEMERVYRAHEDKSLFQPYDEKEQGLFFELNKNCLSTAELDTSLEADPTNHWAASESDDKDAVKDEEELETIAEEIMKLDDCSQTRQIRDKVKELEDRRDQLLERRSTLQNHRGRGSRVQARAERKRLDNVRDFKLARQAKILTDLINYRPIEAMKDLKEWENELAIRYYGTPLRKNASGKTKEPVIDTVDQKLKEIILCTSRITTATAAN